MKFFISVLFIGILIAQDLSIQGTVYDNNSNTIIDANITTLIAAIILFIMGSGPVKGFSVTLGIGIITTLFSVYFISRLLNSIYVTSNKNKSFYILR